MSVTPTNKDALTVHVEGIGWWSPEFADWAGAERWLREEAAPTRAHDGKPAATVLAPGERRRAPDLVLLACEVAAQAVAAAGREAAGLPCVFASMRGDVATTDALCATLAEAPLEVSPTRFHNSVHNAPAGYWTVATGCHAASTALAAGPASFAAGLLEAALETLSEGTPVVFAAYDIAARGPLAEVVHANTSLGMAFVLSGERGERTRATLRLRHAAGMIATAADAHPLAAALPLLRALARGEAAALRLPAGTASTLVIEVLA